jgi:heme/copper-type cytochrome/quinol oxidase subunit 2
MRWGGFFYFLSMLVFSMVIALAIFGLNLYNNNYPDRPVAGKQKNIFNWLFLINFLFLAFLFGFVFSTYGELKGFSKLLNIPFTSLPSSFIFPFVLDLLNLILQFIILYGLYSLRRTLYRNFAMKKQFDFEETNS